MGNNGARRHRVAQLRGTLNQLGAQKLLKLHRLNAPDQTVVFFLQGNDIANNGVRQPLAYLRFHHIQHAGGAIKASNQQR